LAAAVENIMVTRPATELEEIFRAHHSSVLRAAYRVTGSMADAEDVAQSVFLRLARGGIDQSRITNLQSYLHRSAVNAALDILRSKAHRDSVPVDAAAELEGNPSQSPERVHSSLEMKQRLRGELGQLNPRAAEMFTLRYLEGLENPEIARMLKTSQAVVAVTLHRTRARLKKGLRDFVKGAS